jgi:DNA-binding beta-propeller fold protein YncE
VSLLLVLVLPLTLLGCGGDGGGDGTSGGNQFVAATASSLANQSFAFPTGLTPNFATRFGLPASQAFALQFGTFTGTTAPVVLESGGQTAAGTVALGSCTFRFDQSTFRTGQGPQAGAQVLTDPCETEVTLRFLRLTDPPSRETVTSAAPTSLTRPNTAFVLTTDFTSGSYSIVDLATRNVTRDIRPGGVHSDAVARAFGGRVYVVNRLDADNIQIIDPQQGYTTPANAQVSVGNGTNPQDIAFVSATKAYVSRYARTAPSLLIINPTTLATLGERDLRSLIKPNDRDGTPEPSFMLVNNGLLYVTLQHLDELAFLFPPVASGEVAVIDPVTDNIVTVIQLPFANPFPQIRFSPTLRRILVSCVGLFGVNDGGIVAIDPTTNTVDPGMRITEAALGGDITDFEIVSSTKAFAVVLDSNFESTLVTFNPSTGQRLATVLGPRSISIPHIAINSRNELYVAVNDETATTPGLRVFDTVTDRDLIPGPLNVGQLPPNWVLFLE